MASEKKQKKKADKAAAKAAVEAAEKAANTLPFFYRQRTKKALWIILIVSCILSLIGGFVVHRHGHFNFERIGIIEQIFPALLGLCSCIAMVVIAKGLGYLLKVKGDFYDDE